MSDDEARREHYRDFYSTPSPDRPVLLVVGNCQAESLRLMLDSPDLRTVRMPAVHELAADDVAPLHAWVARTSYLLAQPVQADYRGLPVGTEQLAELLPATGTLVRAPVVRHAGLYPYHAIVHLPAGDPEGGDPPVVAYHDLRTVRAVAWTLAGATRPPLRPLTPEAVRAVGAASSAELRRRERVNGTVAVADLLERPSYDDLRTVNHPGNPLLRGLAARLRDAAHLPAHEPTVDRPLLDALHAPRHPVVTALCDPEAAPQPDWRIDGRPVSEAEVADAQSAWLRDRPRLVAEILRRYAGTCAALGLDLPAAVA